MAASSSVRGGVDRLAHLLEGAAAADIRDGFVDVLVRRFRFVLEKRGHGHDHARLAVAALRNVIGYPGLLHLVQGARRREPLDRGDLFANGFADEDATRAHGNAIDMDGAGPALCNAATIFGASKAGIFADSPQQWSIRLDFHVKSFAVDCEASHRLSRIRHCNLPLRPDAELDTGSIHLKL